VNFDLNGDSIAGGVSKINVGRTLSAKQQITQRFGHAKCYRNKERTNETRPLFDHGLFHDRWAHCKLLSFLKHFCAAQGRLFDQRLLIRSSSKRILFLDSLRNNELPIGTSSMSSRSIPTYRTVDEAPQTYMYQDQHGCGPDLQLYTQAHAVSLNEQKLGQNERFSSHHGECWEHTAQWDRKTARENRRLVTFTARNVCSISTTKTSCTQQVRINLTYLVRRNTRRQKTSEHWVLRETSTYSLSSSLYANAQKTLGLGWGNEDRRFEATSSAL